MIDGWMAVGHLSSEGIREGWSFAKNVRKIATCSQETQNCHVLKAKIGPREQVAFFRAFFVTVNHDQDLALHRSFMHFGFNNCHRTMNILLVFAVKLTQDLRDPLQEQVVS